MNQAVIRRHWPMFAAVVIAELCDLATFLMGIARVGINAEDNGFARQLYLTMGAAGPVMLKLVTLGVLGGLLWFIAMRHPERLMIASLVVVVVAMVGVWGNVTFGIVR